MTSMYVEQSQTLQQMGRQLGVTAEYRGVGITAVRNHLRHPGIELRPGVQPCPWNQRRLSR